MASFDRESALSYLAERHLLTKSPEKYSTSYVVRLARKFQQQEQAGHEPSRTEARGHARASVEHIAKDGHRLNQYRIMRPPLKGYTPSQLQDIAPDAFTKLLAKGRGLDHSDLKNLYNRTPKHLENFMVAITGIGQDSKEPSKSADPRDIHTYSFASDREQIASWLEDNTDADISDFARDISGLEWDGVYGISFVYPESMN